MPKPTKGCSANWRGRRRDATITNFTDNCNQLNMFRAIISPILRSTRLFTACLQAAPSVHYTTSCKHSLVLHRMGEIIARNMLSWLQLSIKFVIVAYSWLFILLSYINVSDSRTDLKTQSITSTINQQMHLYNFHLKHLKPLRHVSIFSDHHERVSSFLAKVITY